MAKPAQPSRHRMTHIESAAFQPCDLGSLSKGDVFVREGTPHMVVEVPAALAGSQEQTWIVNLISGGCWPHADTAQVYPAFDVNLTFSSGRRSS